MNVVILQRTLYFIQSMLYLSPGTLQICNDDVTLKKNLVIIAMSIKRKMVVVFGLLVFNILFVFLIHYIIIQYIISYLHCITESILKKTFKVIHHGNSSELYNTLTEDKKTTNVTTRST